MARFTTAAALLSITGEANPLPLPHADGDLHAQGLRGGLLSVRVSPLEPNLARRALQHFVERYEEVTFDILAALGKLTTVSPVLPSVSKGSG